jgi:hypothetical protein
MIGRQSNTAMRIFMAVIACVAWFALLLQFPLTIATSRANGMTLLGAVIAYLSFFTILTNLIVAVGLTCSLLLADSRWGGFFSSPVVVSGTALYTAIVGALYSFLLRQLWNPQGFQKIADVLLHDVVLLAYVTYWILFVPKGRLRWRDTAWWSIYPLVYLALILIRGAISGRYPYPFIHAGSLGYARALSNAMTLFAGFLAAGLLLVAMDKLQRPKA